MRYGWFMARNGDETGAGGDSAGWLGRVCERLKAKVDEALDAVCEAPKVEGVAEAEKLARAVGVIARAAKAVAALEPRLAADSEEDEMGGRTYDPEEDERLRRELAAHCDRLGRQGPGSDRLAFPTQSPPRGRENSVSDIGGLHGRTGDGGRGEAVPARRA